MRPLTRHPLGLMVPRSPAILTLTLAALVALSGLVQAQPAAQPKTTAQPKTAAQPKPAPKPKTAPKPKAATPPGASPAKQPAQPAPAAAAQPSYEPLTYTDGLKNARTGVYRWLRGGEIPADQRDTFERYFKEYEIGRWTQPDQLHELPARRNNLLNAVKSAKISAAHDELVTLLLDFLSTLAGEANRHPAARYNAMLTIGELNQREADGRRAPQPLPEALSVLLGAFTDANQIDAVRVAALLGLYRHAAIGITDAQFRDTQLIPAMLDLVQAKTAPERAPEGHAWMRARAIDVLGALGQVGEQNAVPNALLAIVADRDNDLLVRCAAARALGGLEYPANHGLDAWKLSSELGQLASDACLAEFEQMEKEAEQEERKQRRPRGGMMGMGYDMYSAGMEEPETMPGMEADMYSGSGMPGAFGRPKEEEEEDKTLNNRRRLITSLNAAFVGLTGMKWSAWTVWVRRNNTDQPNEGVASLGAGSPQADLITGEEGLLKQFEGLFEACEPAEDDEDPLDRESLRAKIDDALTPLTHALSAGQPPDTEEPAEPAESAEPAAKPAESPEPAAKPAAEPAPKPAAGQPAGSP